MIKPCKFCHKNFTGPANKLYCKPKCKKSFENSLRVKGGKRKKGTGSAGLSVNVEKPPQLDGYAAAFWDKTAPILIARGHLNTLSEDAFAELCDLVARLRDINITINESGRSLLQGGEKSSEKSEDKADTRPEPKADVEMSTMRESALSDLKRKYSNLLLVYSKQFYLTPLSNRGSFDMPDPTKDPLDEFMRGKSGH